MGRSPTIANPAPSRQPDRRTIRRQIQLSFGKSVRIAIQNIRARLGRSLLVMSGIILAIAFLAYMLGSEAMLASIAAHGSPSLVDELERLGVLADLNDRDSRIQTRWMIGLALLICFVGVLNATLLSVTERFAEIGTMKCLGALNSLVIRLFLLESTFQGLVGTLLGVLFGLTFAILEGWATYGWAVWSHLPVMALVRGGLLCLVMGTALTICGALYPAWRAARMQPVAALRSEA